MALVTCPECGREGVSNMAKSCPTCGFPISEQYANAAPTPMKSSEPTETQKSSAPQAIVPSAESTVEHSKESKSKKRKTVIATIIVLVIAWSIWFFATRCSADGCYSRAEQNSNYCSYHNYMRKLYRASSSSSTKSYSSKNQSDLKISNVNVKKTSSTMYCTGTIKNNGKDTFKFVKVKAAFKDWSGDTIETGDSYAVGGEGLAPGESTSFTIYASKKNDKVESCTVSVYDYD